MKFCMKHWDELRQAMKDRGMWHLVASSGEKAAEQLENQLETGTRAHNFDPLMAAHNSIVEHSIEAAGLAIMVNNEDGSERCPLCYVQDNCGCKKLECHFLNWVPEVADVMKDEAIRLGLMPAAVLS